MLDLIDLRAFTRIADMGSVSGAARSLGCPKSSVSRSLARLEAALGTLLIERSTRHFRVTDAGVLLHGRARRILDEVAEAESAVGGLAGVPTGTLRVSVPFTFAAGPLARMLPDFLARFPQVRVVLTVDNRLVDLLTDEVDIAIRIGPLGDSDLIARKLTRFALWPCASPAYLERRGTPRTVADLKGHVFIAHADRRVVWRAKAPHGVIHEFEIIPSTVVPEPAVVKTILVNGGGIGWLPDFDAAPAIADGTLRRVLPDHEGDGVDAHAVYPVNRSLSAKVRVFVEVLIAHLQAA